MLKFGAAKIELYFGDITDLEVDAIVNAANNHFFMGAGVAGAIKRKGGVEIEKEAVSKGPVEVGEAVVTSAGKLKCKYVIHAAVMGLDFKTDENKIRKATENALKRAEELKIKSIAFPAFGTGVGRFSVSECAKIMVNVVKEHLKGKSCLEKVVFALFSEEIYEKFEKVSKTLLKSRSIIF
ncbi:MAG: macro domain-containing protein [Candidatus Thermoplasmatota archaeon]